MGVIMSTAVKQPLRSAMKSRSPIVMGSIAFLLVTAVWMVGVAVFDVPRTFLPGPDQVARAWQGLADSGRLWEDTLVSLLRLALGAAAGISTGVLLGILVGLNENVRASLEPFVNFFTGISGVIWIPIAFAWFGVGFAMSTFIIWNSVFFLVFANTALGVSSVSPSLKQAVSVMGGGYLRIVRDVCLPGALPQIFNGIRTGVSFGWRALIAAELLGSPQGLGALINQAGTYQRSDQILAGCLTIGVLGMLIDRVLIGWIERKTIGRWGTVTSAQERG